MGRHYRKDAVKKDDGDGLKLASAVLQFAAAVVRVVQAVWPDCPFLPHF